MTHGHWLEGLLHNLGKLNLANEANGLLDLQEVQRTDREAVRAHHRNNNDNFDDPGDQMGNIDMSTHHHHPNASRPRASRLIPLAVAGVLVAGGLGAAVPIAMGLMDRTPPVQADPPPDADTRYGLDLADPLPQE